MPLPEIDGRSARSTFHVHREGLRELRAHLDEPPDRRRRRKGEDAVVTYHAASETIGDSLVLHVRDAAPDGHGRDPRDRRTSAYLMVRAPAQLGARRATYRPRTWVILDDVSASRDALERRAQADVIDAFLRELDEEDQVAVIAFDVSARQKLAPTRVLDVDRKALRASLKGEGGVGATDFGAALEAATKMLAGVAPEDAIVVYLGDGVITSGARNLDALRAQLVGKAHFVGVGVGDGPDTQTLDVARRRDRWVRDDDRSRR